MKLFYVKKGDTIYDYYETIPEAYFYKKKLMDNQWDINCLIDKVIEVIEINKKLDVNTIYEVHIKYCPHCRHRIKKNIEECPHCGIKLKDYY